MATHVFISYAREDASTANAVADDLSKNGLTVWWDRSLVVGQVFAEAIRSELEAAERVIVLWSKNSVKSPWVLDEASRARDLQKLLPVRIDDCPIPLGFGSLNTLEYTNWGHEAPRIANRIRELSGTAARPAEPIKMPVQRSEPEPAANAPKSQEDLLWEAIKDGQSADDFEFFLRRFPTGRYVNVARLKLSKLKVPAPAAPPVSSPVGSVNGSAGIADIERQVVDSGDGEAIYELAERFYWGDGTDQDYAKARTLFEQAAKLGVGQAMARLGVIHELGRGVPEDIERAVAWYRKGADVNNAFAMRALGLKYDLGKGVPHDPSQAVVLYERAAKLGDVGSMSLLASCYNTGQGCARDYAKAYHWAKQAAEGGDGDGMYLMAELSLLGNGTAADPRAAANWFSRAAEAGDSRAMRSLGSLYQDGVGVAQDLAKARSWYERAAASGNGDSMWRLGLMYEHGEGVPADLAKARTWYEKGAEAGDPDAMSALGMMHEFGNGVPVDNAEAARWYKAAADRNHAFGMYSLGTMYLFGNGVEVDEPEAFRLISAAAELGNVTAMAFLGVMHKDGVGCPQDDVEAVRWLQASIERRPTTLALRNLAHMRRVGRGMVEDKAAARACYDQAVEMGDRQSMWPLAIMCDEGVGGPADPGRAAHMLLTSADNGDQEALEHFGKGLKQWSSPTRVAVQEVLRQGGHYDGLINGVYSLEMEEALERFLMRPR